MSREELRQRKRLIGWLAVWWLVMAAVAMVVMIAVAAATHGRQMKDARVRVLDTPWDPLVDGMRADADELAQELADRLREGPDPQPAAQDWVSGKSRSVLFTVVVGSGGQVRAAFPNEVLLKSLTFDVAANAGEKWEPAMQEIERAGLPHPTGESGWATYIDPTTNTIAYVLVHTKD